jgi:hypothetical protein
VTTNGSGTIARASDRFIHGGHALLATLNPASGSGDMKIELFNSAPVQPGKNMTVFVNIPSGQNWSYVQAYAQDGPAKNYRFNTMGYLQKQIIPGEWTSIVVPVPADFSIANSKIGVQLYPTGSGTIKLYVDAISFQD